MLHRVAVGLPTQSTFFACAKKVAKKAQPILNADAAFG
jgi:hypothetical protein